jgi:hypothetical protein
MVRGEHDVIPWLAIRHQRALGLVVVVVGESEFNPWAQDQCLGVHGLQAARDHVGHTVVVPGAPDITIRKEAYRVVHIARDAHRPGEARGAPPAHARRIAAVAVEGTAG